MRTTLSVVCLMSGVLLGACSGANRSAAVSAVNLSDTSLRVSATLDPGTGDQSVGRVDLAPGTSGGFALAIPQGGSDRGVEFRLEPVSGGAPTLMSMSPPGPYLLRIVGVGGTLQLEREVVEAAGRESDLGVPPDPARSTWGGGIRP